MDSDNIFSDMCDLITENWNKNYGSIDEANTNTMSEFLDELEA